MRRFAAWSCLCIILAGPLVVQARIAYGIALSRSEAGKSNFESDREEADEDFDGHELVGVALQQGAASADVLLAPDLLPGLALLALPSLPASADLSGAATPRAGPWRRPPPDASRRHSLLQSFRC